MIRAVFLGLLPMLCAAPARAQPMDPNMPGMQMPAAAQSKDHPAKSPGPGKAHRATPGMDTPGMNMSGRNASGAAPAAASGNMAGMKMPNAAGATPAPGAPNAGDSTPVTEPAIPDTPPLPPARDHLADRYYGAASMAAARRMARTEMGGGVYSKVMINLLEYQAGAHGGGYRWEGQAWFGGDINRLVIRSEGEGSLSGRLGTGEVQALYSRAVGRYLDLQAGVRQDVSPHARSYLALGAQSLFPYWFDVEGGLYLSPRGELLGRTEVTYDLRLFQRVVLQPRVELNLAAQDSPATRTGSGLSTAEAGLRLRYEIRREFAPYVGVSWERRFGRTADYWRAAGDGPSSTTVVVGLSTFF
ncbi:MAG: copper resistance protein B [Alphaproteobacteria bacterium]|nr:copper resistance protein B [Alphaproteobacteria bacterium]